jgi:hypothetical protein
VDDRRRADLIHFEPARQRPGQLGATYWYTDTAPANGLWWYWLADVDTRGQETYAPQASANVDVDTSLRYRVFLPLVLR